MTHLPKSVFERNPKKTIAAVICVIIMFLDISIERLVDNNALFSKLLNALNANLAYKVGIWQHRTENIYYHHDLEPNHDIVEIWGGLRYRLITNSLGFKDSAKRTVQLDAGKKRILFIGDSFTEGIGLPYEKTFVGLIDKKLDHEKFEVLNAAVVSYSPKIYYHKVKYLLENVHLHVDELFVFIDISDIYNELEYEIFDPQEPDTVGRAKLITALKAFGQHNSFIYNVARYYFSQYEQSKKQQSLDYVLQHRNETGHWTLNESIYHEWGEKGVKLAKLHMQKLADLCKDHGIALTIAVYPWQNELIAGKKNSRQIEIWRDFAETNKIGFINYYPDFFDSPVPGIEYSKVKPYDIINRYFIPGDIHWNENGHRLIADKIQIR